jgi:hypothetical protein
MPPGVSPAPRPPQPTLRSLSRRSESPATTDRRLRLLSKSRERLADVRKSESAAEAKLRELADEVAELQQRVQGEENRAEALTMFAALSVAEQAELESSHPAAIATSLDQTEASVEDLRSSLAVERAKLLDEREAAVLAKAELNDLRKATADAEAEYSTVARRANGLDEDRSRLRQRAQEAETLQRRADALQQQIDGRRSTNEVHRARLRDATAAKDALMEAADVAAQQSQQLWSSLTVTVDTLPERRLEAQRLVEAAKNREAFELRVLRERLHKAQEERDRTKAAALTVECELHRLKESHRAAERAEDREALLECVARYEFEIARLRQDLALRPPAEQVDEKREALRAQVTSLSVEHAHLMDDLDLVSQDGGGGKAALASRCDDLRDRLQHAERMLVAEAKRRRQDAASRNFEAKCTIEQWEEDEGPRHEAFVARLEAEAGELRDRLAARETAAAERRRALVERRDALVRGNRDLRAELRERGAEMLGAEDSGDDAGSGVGVDMRSAAIDVTPSRVMEVELVQQRRANTDTDQSPGPLQQVVTRHPVRAPPRPVVYTTPEMLANERHFNFLAVSVVNSFIGMIRRAGRRRNPTQAAPTVSV